MSASQKHTNHYPKYTLVEHKGQLAVAIPVNNEDKTRIWARFGHDRVRLSFNSKFFMDLLGISMDKLAMMRRQPTLWVLEQNQMGKTIAEYEVAVVAKE